MRTSEEWKSPTGQTYWVHPKDKCDGGQCMIHNPTNHYMRDWPVNLRETGLFERLCEHGIGHPDPDSAAYFGEGWSVHGCDGCCRPTSHPVNPSSSTG